MWLTLYLLAVAALALETQGVLSQPGAHEFAILLGLAGAWRGSWGAMHLGRALYYRGVAFPRLRRAADRLEEAGGASHVYILIATARIRAETTARVYQAALAEAIRYGRPATIVAAVVERGDQRLIKHVFHRMQPPVAVRLAFVRRPGTGRRHRLACSLRAVSRLRPSGDAAVVLLDGDTLLTPGCLERSLPFLRLMPDVDAIATDRATIAADGAAMQAWRDLRRAQRHQAMSSLGLSRRILASTRGMSILRAEVAIDPAFIDAIENDRTESGCLPLPSDDDGAAWCWLLREGRRTLYVPDARVVTVGPPPAKALLPAARSMLRPSGGTLPASFWMVALGPRRIGLFPWCWLVERCISVWMPLLGLAVAALLALAQSLQFLYAYLLWIAVTRLAQALPLLTARPTISGLDPPLIYLDQIHAALVSASIVLRPARPRRPRPASAFEVRPPPWQPQLQSLGPAYLHLLVIGALITAIAFSTRLLSLPPLL